MSFSSSYDFSFFYLYQNDETTPPPSQNPIPIPIQSSSAPTPIPIPIHYPTSVLTAAATKIQSSYRSHLIRTLIRKILTIDSQTDRFRDLIQQQETVDSVRNSEKERMRLNENLMGLLLSLDSIPGHFDPNVRELRRKASRRIAGLLEILDGIVGERMDGTGFEGLPGSWEEFVEKIWTREEREEMSERGGLCKGLRCLEEFVMGI